MGINCGVPGCESKVSETKMHVLPGDNRFKIWATFIGRPDLDISKRKSYRICDKHFPEEMKYATFHNVTNLKKTALPVNKEVQRNADVEEAYSTLEVNVSRPNELVQEPGSLKELAVPGPNKLKDLGIKTLVPRFLNQDPLENFFGKVRQRGSRWSNPSCHAFGPFYKSLLVTNLVSKHSVGGNCEDDGSDLLIPLQTFILQSENQERGEAEITAVEIPSEVLSNIFNDLEKNAIAYVGGYILKNIKIKKCEKCKYNVFLQQEEENEFLNFVREKEFGGAVATRLNYINSKFLLNMTKAYNIAKFILKNDPNKKHLLKVIRKTVFQNVNFNFVECEHSTELKFNIVHNFCKMIVFTYFNGFNSILAGKDLRSLPFNSSSLYKIAKKLHDQYKHAKK
ncbi:uncharacterized protein LOC123302277 isoform X1 [Chrysoperla carnea]|uniref:uncharacterized protein LOC123302277 isoform X1 n=1 Tax=Chrysoperla carnea TaxID=189513 RepID=UPI001D08BBE6|nr:uncharacterized protein LOC123302277 isoform X1 [Chrysoperla carnea]